MKNILSILALVLSTLSCSKDVKYEQDLAKPTIKVEYPTDNPKLKAGDPLCMKVLINDNKSLANVWLQVNAGNGFQKEYAVTGRSIDIIEKYTAPPGVNGSLIAKFFATDEAGNMSVVEISFSVNN